MNIWEGVYKSFEEAEKYRVGGGYSSQAGLNSLVKKATNNVYYSNTPLPFYASIYKSPNILDFGGGIGRDADLIQNEDFFYTVVENKFICDMCSTKSGNYINFVDKIPFGNYDIAHFNSSIHYAKDWRSVISSILERNDPDIFIFHDVPCGDFNSFVTLQNFYGSKIPVWFFNEEDLVMYIQGLGYDLTYLYECRMKYFGVECDIPMDNFSNNHKIKNSKGFVFEC